MPELQTLAHGETNWDSKVNKIIDYLMEGQAISDMKMSDWSNDGIVLASDFKWIENSKGYRYIHFPNGKLIELDLKFTVLNFADLVYADLITLPDLSRPDSVAINAGFWGGEAGGIFDVTQWDNKISIYRRDNDSKDTWHGDFYVHALYFHHD